MTSRPIFAKSGATLSCTLGKLLTVIDHLAELHLTDRFRKFPSKFGQNWKYLSYSSSKKFSAAEDNRSFSVVPIFNLAGYYQHGRLMKSVLDCSDVRTPLSRLANIKIRAVVRQGNALELCFPTQKRRCFRRRMADTTSFWVSALTYPLTNKINTRIYLITVINQPGINKYPYFFSFLEGSTVTFINP